MAPGHQLHHLYIRAHSTRPQHQYLRILTDYFCLWRVTYSDESAQAILYHFPGPQASLHPHSTDWHVISWWSSGVAADRHTIYVRAKQPDQSSGTRHPRTKTVHQCVSQHHNSRRQAPRHAEETSGTTILSRIAGHPDHTTDIQKKTEKMWIYTLRSIAPHGINVRE